MLLEALYDGGISERARGARPSSQSEVDLFSG
jgi:hypothetical protein